MKSCSTQWSKGFTPLQREILKGEQKSFQKSFNRVCKINLTVFDCRLGLSLWTFIEACE